MSVLALSTAGAILIGVVSGLVVLLAGIATIAGLRRPRRPRGVDIPSGMRPGPSDADLEKPLLEKLQVWGMLSVVFMAIWIPVVWLREPPTNADDLRRIQEESVERGRLTTLPGSEENQLGFNCVRCHGEGLRGGLNVFNDNVVQVPPLHNVCERLTLDQIVEVISEGRPNTDMPSWSVQFAGAMNDAQITDVVNYLLSIQQVPEEQNRCLREGVAAEEAPVEEEAPGEEASPTPPP